MILVAPESRGATWDWFATSSFGPDVAFIAAALAQARALYAVDAARLGMQGFSDGATYALSLGAPAPGRPPAGAARAASARPDSRAHAQGPLRACRPPRRAACRAAAPSACVRARQGSQTAACSAASWRTRPAASCPS